jgi:hypothetical protein
VTGLLGEFHALVDGGAGWNTVQMEQLEGAEAQGDQDLRVEPGVGVLEEGLQLVVEANLPAEHTEDQGGGQVAVWRGESIDSFAAEQVV